MWATKLGEMAGVKVPLIAMHHAYVVTQRIEGIQVGFLFPRSVCRLCCFVGASACLHKVDTISQGPSESFMLFSQNTTEILDL